MAKKKTKISTANYVLPSNYKDLELETRQHKLKLMTHVVNVIEYAVHHNLTNIKVFEFKDSDFVIEISDKEYLSNLNNIYEYYIKCENYESCSKVSKLQNIIKSQTGHIINYEKETS